MSHLPLIIEKYLNQTSPFTRFLFVGVINTLVGLSVTFLFLNLLEQSYWTSTFIGNSIGAICSFLLNRTFTFNSDAAILTGGIRFILVILVCYFLSYTLSSYLIQFFQFRGVLSNREFAVLLGTIFYTVSNYIGQKYVVFHKRKR